MNTKNWPHIIERISQIIPSDDLYISLAYVDHNALEELGRVHIRDSYCGKFCAAIRDVLFENGDGSWTDCSPSPSISHAQALEDYFWRLRTTRTIKKWDQEFRWNKEGQRFERKEDES